MVGDLSAPPCYQQSERAISLTSTYVHVVHNGEPEDAEIAAVSPRISPHVTGATFSNLLCHPCISEDAKVNEEMHHGETPALIHKCDF